MMSSRFQWARDCVTFNGGRILDIGCNTGEMFAGMDGIADFMGVDTDKFQLPSAYNLGFKIANAEKLPFKDKEFHMSVLSEVIEHTKNPVKAIKEAIRVANRVLITTPNEYNWDAINKPFQNESHVRYYRTDTLMKDLGDAGVIILMFKQLNYDGWSFFTVIGR